MRVARVGRHDEAWMPRAPGRRAGGSPGVLDPVILGRGASATQPMARPSSIATAPRRVVLDEREPVAFWAGRRGEVLRAHPPEDAPAEARSGRPVHEQVTRASQVRQKPTISTREDTRRLPVCCTPAGGALSRAEPQPGGAHSRDLSRGRLGGDPSRLFAPSRAGAGLAPIAASGGRPPVGRTEAATIGQPKPTTRADDRRGEVPGHAVRLVRDVADPQDRSVTSAPRMAPRAAQHVPSSARSLPARRSVSRTGAIAVRPLVERPPTTAGRRRMRRRSRGGGSDGFASGLTSRRRRP